ncbi:MAG: DUF86 domain-containing protein [Anaerolineales bacterium]|nr:DUF86 domain-containing protein [Anaerolineales bacterium]
MRPEHLYPDRHRRRAPPLIVGMVDADAFLADELRQSAVLQKLIVIGEAASHLSGEFCASHPDTPWSDIVGFRNIADAYFSVMWDIVWILTGCARTA